MQAAKVSAHPAFTTPDLTSLQRMLWLRELGPISSATSLRSRAICNIQTVDEAPTPALITTDPQYCEPNKLQEESPAATLPNAHRPHHKPESPALARLRQKCPATLHPASAPLPLTGISLMEVALLTSTCVLCGCDESDCRCPGDGGAQQQQQQGAVGTRAHHPPTVGLSVTSLPSTLS